VLVQIARPYAQALFDLARGDNTLDPVESGLNEISALIDDSPDFARFLNSPVIGADEKSATLEILLKDMKPVPVVGNLLRVVARNGRLFAVPAIIKAFRDLAAAARGETTAEVTSAAPLGHGQLDALKAALREKIGKTVTLTEHVDPSLIGGLVVKVGSRMIDSSLKTKLAAMRVAMKEVG
jgi:F-type H+-transporting ATPase subunit delta